MAYLLLLFYIAVIFIRPHEWDAVGAASPIIRVTVILTFFAYLFTQRDKKFAPQFLYVGLMGLIICLSSVFNGWAGGAFYNIIEFLPTTLLPLLVVSGIIDTSKKQKGVMIICLIATMFMVHNGYTQHQSTTGYGWAAGTHLVEEIRITYVGIFHDPNDIAMFLVMCVPFAVYFMAKSSFFMKMVYFLVLAALVYGVILTNSRGGLLGLMSLLGAYFLYRYGLKKSIFAGLVSLPVLLLVASKFRTIEQGESANGRVDAWFVGMHDMFLNNPILGVGKGAFTDYNSHTAHNSFVLVISELGYLGYLFWFAALSLSVVMLFNTVKWYKKLSVEEKIKLPENVKVEAELSLVLLFSFVGYLSTCFFLSRSYIILLFVFMGMAIASYYRTIKVIPELEIKDFSYYFKRDAKWAFLSIIAFFIIVRVLL